MAHFSKSSEKTPRLMQDPTGPSFTQLAALSRTLWNNMLPSFRQLLYCGNLSYPIPNVIASTREYLNIEFSYRRFSPGTI